MVEEYVKLEGHRTPEGPTTGVRFTTVYDIYIHKGERYIVCKDYQHDKKTGTLLNSAFTLAQIAAKRPHPDSTEGIAWLGTYHPIVWACMVKFGEPEDLNKLANENPAPSLDNTKLAYFRDEKKMALGVRTAVAAGRYIKRHWPNVKDNEIAELVRIHFPQPLQLKFLTTLPEMIHAAINGPYSCMKFGHLDVDEYDKHPYNCYSPELGWNLAVLVEGDKVRSRALTQAADKIFVRTFSDAEDDTNACPELNAQLVAAGYTKFNDWEGYEIAKIKSENNRAGYLFPYIDGGAQHVYDNDETWKITGDEDLAEFECNDSDGSASRVERHECANCDYTTTDSYNLNHTEDGDVCNRCLDDYTWAVESRFHRIYTTDTTYSYDGSEYTENGLETNGLVLLADGDVAHRDKAIEIDGEYYLESDCHPCDHSHELCKRDDLVLIKRGSKMFYIKEEYVEEYESDGWEQC